MSRRSVIMVARFGSVGAAEVVGVEAGGDEMDEGDKVVGEEIAE